MFFKYYWKNINESGYTHMKDASDFIEDTRSNRIAQCCNAIASTNKYKQGPLSNNFIHSRPFGLQRQFTLRVAIPDSFLTQSGCHFVKSVIRSERFDKFFFFSLIEQQDPKTPIVISSKQSAE